MKPERKVHHADACEWLRENGKHRAIITSLPDLSELQTNLGGWIRFVIEACEALDSALDEGGVIWFYQTNRKYNRTIVNKHQFIGNEFLQRGYQQLHHKIALARDPGKVDLYRPTFTQLFSFSKSLTAGRATPDVFHRGEMIYPNAMGTTACIKAISYVQAYVDTDTILDPFCGMGSVLAVSNAMGLHAVGVDIDKDMCHMAEKTVYKPKDDGRGKTN